jgi:hypothetical protein
MIVLKIDPNTGVSDFLNLSLISPTAAAAIQWYCTWNITPNPGLPYDRFWGTATGPSITQITTAVPLAAEEFDIREIAIHNTRNEPVSIAIDWSNGAAPLFRLISCGLGANHTLTYNAIPGTDGASWKIYDGSGHLVSQQGG